MAKLFDSPDMRETIRRFIRSQMAAKALEYKHLSVRLGALGVVQTESNLRSKVNSGALGAQLFIYILLAMGLDSLDMATVELILSDVQKVSE